MLNLFTEESTHSNRVMDNSGGKRASSARINRGPEQPPHCAGLPVLLSCF